MRQSELIAYLQLCRTKEPDSKNIDLLLNQLDEQSKHNLIHAAMALKKKREAQQLVLSKSFPSLSHEEKLKELAMPMVKMTAIGF